MATYALPAAYKTSNGKDITVGDFSVVATFEILTDTLFTTSSGATSVPTLAAGDIVQMVYIPVGVTVLDGYLITDAITSTSVSVGDQSSGNADRYVAAQDQSSAAKRYFASAEAFPKTYTTADTIDVTFTTGIPSAGTVTLVLFCTSDTVDLT